MKKKLGKYRLLSRFLAVYGVRNTMLEDLHAGKYPSSKTKDFSDVKVVSPYGEIPWNELSRINDKEMRELMLILKSHNMIYWLICILNMDLDLS